MAEEDKDSQREVLAAGKKEEHKAKDEEMERPGEHGERRDQQGYDYGQYPPPPGAYPPPPPAEPMMTARNMHRILAIGVLIGVIILFVGTLLIVSSAYVTDDWELQNNLHTSGRLIDGIGLFLTGLLLAIPLMVIRDLTVKQRALLVIILAAVIIGFTLI